MITTCAAFLIFVLFFAGGQFETHPIAAFVLGGLCACALGGLFAHLEAGLTTGHHTHQTDGDFFLPAMSLQNLVKRYPDYYQKSIYIRVGPDFKPVMSSFICRLDGVQAIVLEQEDYCAQESGQDYNPV